MSIILLTKVAISLLLKGEMATFAMDEATKNTFASSLIKLN